MKDEPKNSEIDRLVDACLDGSLTEAEAAKLSELIETSSQARERYWELASIHGLLEQSLQNASLKAATGEVVIPLPRSRSLLHWQPLTAVAAGIVIGIFSASMVWAYRAPLGARVEEERKEIIFESFEDADLTSNHRFPTHAGEWFGQFTSVLQKGSLSAMRGERVAQFIDVPERKFSYAQTILDLEEYGLPEAGKSRSVEVRASFFSADPEISGQYQIRLGAFSQEPEGVRRIWNREELLFDTVLQHVGQNYVTEPGVSGWKKLRATLELPPGTRSVVISLGAGNAEAGTPPSEHYLDAVRVYFNDTTILPE